MAIINVKDQGTWKPVKLAWAKSGGVWQRAKKVFVKQSGVWTQVYPQSTGTATFSTPGTYSFTVPYGVTQVALDLTGGGGGGGGNDASHNGYPGYPGERIYGTLTVNPGDVITIHVGGGGLGGTNSQASAPGGAGGYSDNGYEGGAGGRAGNEGSSGGGGGGGAATTVAVNGVIVAVAGGGGGGGGSGNNSNGQPQDGTGGATGTEGGQGEDKTTGGGGGGGGGKIICTKLHELGYLPDHIYEADERFGQYLRENDPYAYYGYVKWASVVVDWMERDGPQCMFWISDPEKRGEAQRALAIKWARRIATPWAEHMAYLMGVGERDNRAGRLIMKTGMWVSRLIGRYTKTKQPSKSVALGYVMWLTFGVFWLLAGVK